MANIVIKKNFVDGDKLFAQQLNNNFETIEKSINDGNKIVWQDGTEVKFKRFITEDIENLPIQEGALIYDIKKGAHYADYKGVRIVIGGDAKQIKISPTEPTTGEEVWIQKGKNLFNKNNLNKISAYIDVATSLITSSINNYLLFIECLPNTTYTIQKVVSGVFGVGYTNELPKEGVKAYNIINDKTLSNATITTGDSAKYIVFRYYHTSNDTTYTEQQILDSIQIEIGESATSYEPYINKKIYTKNDNGYYEEFYDETNLHKYSLSEQKIGTWLGKPLYRRVYDCGNLGAAGTKETPTNLSNVNYVDWEGVALASGGGTAYPYKMAVTGNDYGVKVEIADNKIRIKTIVDLYDYTGYVTILYTKN